MLSTSLFTGVAIIDGLTFVGVANGTKVVAQGAAGGGHATGIQRAGGGLGGPGPLDGTLIVNVLSLFNLVVPLDPIGSTGATTSVTVDSIIVKVLGTGWTTGTVTLTGLDVGFVSGSVVDTLTFAGYDNRSPGHAGSLLLISPFKAITNAAGNLAGLATQSLTFVPEPATLLLLAGGCVALGLHGLRGPHRG